jgi:hypothetical protein
VYKKHLAKSSCLDWDSNPRSLDGPSSAITLSYRWDLSDCGTFVEVKIGKQESSAMWFCLWADIRFSSFGGDAETDTSTFLLLLKKRFFWTHWWTRPTSDLMMPTNVCCPKPRIAHNNTQSGVLPEAPHKPTTIPSKVRCPRHISQQQHPVKCVTRGPT